MNKSKGFTIIELIVVIAIIAVLAGIVLVNVTQYINKGRDVAAEGNLATMLTNGAVFYDANSTFKNFIGADAKSGTYGAGSACATGDSGFTGPCSAATGLNASTGYDVNYACSDGAVPTPAAVNCKTGDVKNWCAYIGLKSTANTYCVDSNGAKVTKSSGGGCALLTGTCVP
jgi:prepilin-type N-terminal cleavage/methylation domain-containing protein